MVARSFLLTATVVAVGCVSAPAPPPRIVEVPVPVVEHREPPAWLAEPYRPETLPVFYEPACLSPEGVAALQSILRTLHSRDKAWRAWASPANP